jgi:hypothetical protein
VWSSYGYENITKVWYRGIWSWILCIEPHNYPRKCPLCELTNVRQVMRRHDAIIVDNATSIFIARRKTHALEKNCNNEMEIIMETFLQ